MNDELERIWKEAVMTYSVCCPGICLDRQEEHEGPHDSQCSCQDSNRAPTVYESRAPRGKLMLLLALSSVLDR
jgi:hypothetical protein